MMAGELRQQATHAQNITSRKYVPTRLSSLLNDPTFQISGSKLSDGDSNDFFNLPHNDTAAVLQRKTKPESPLMRKPLERVRGRCVELKIHWGKSHQFESHQSRGLRTVLFSCWCHADRRLRPSPLYLTWSLRLLRWGEGV